MPINIESTLDKLLATKYETETIEFKEAKDNCSFDELGKYFSALSNEANLHNEECAWLVFGVEDKKHIIVGTNYRNDAKSLNSLKEEIGKQTSENLTFIEQDRSADLEPLPDFVIVDGTLKKYFGKDSAVCIPEGIITIGYNAFADCKNIVEVHMPEGVEQIDDFAFRDCYNLATIDIPENVKEIGSFAFSSCFKLDSLILPKELRDIRSFAFSGCGSLREIRIPENIISIEDNAFSNCRNLEDVYITDSVQKIGKNVFTNDYSSSELIKIHAPSGSCAQKYAEDNNIRFVAE